MKNRIDVKNYEEVVDAEEKTKWRLSKVLYVGLCIVCLVVGIILVIISYTANLGKAADVLESLGWNFLASGIISALFSIELYSSNDKHKNELMLQQIKEAFYDELNENGSLLRRYVNEDQLKDIVKTRLQDAQDYGVLNIDVMGVSLLRFCNDQLSPFIDLFKAKNDHKVLGNKNCKIRMIVQKPDDDMLRIIAMAEGKDVGVLKSRINSTIKTIKDITEMLKSSKQKEHAEIELRFNDDSPAQTITRINDAIFPQVRPVKRMANKECSKPFFNCYEKDREEEQFRYMLDYFDAVWDDSASTLE